MDAIDAFLARQSEAGVTDSEGTFTVAGDRALDKLANFQLPRTSAWLLKMLQAGVVGGASGMWISHSHKSCKIRYKDADFGELEDFERFWTHPSPIVNAGQAELFIGLRTVAFSRRRPVLIGHKSDRFGIRTLFWNGASLSPIESLSSGFGSSLKIGWPDTGEFIFYVSGSPLGRDDSTKAVHGIKSVVAAEFKELQKHGVSSPVPTWVEGRPLNHFGLQDVSMTRKALAFSVQSPEDEAAGPLLKLPGKLSADYGLEQGGRLAWTLYHSKEPGNSVVSWVQKGVVCEEESLGLPSQRFQVRLFLPADDLENDLTALHLRFPAPEERQRRIREAVVRFCDEVRPDSSIIRALATQEPKSGGAWVAAAGLLFGGVLLAPLTSGYSLLAGGAAAVGVRTADRKAAERAAVPALNNFRASLLSRYGDTGSE